MASPNLLDCKLKHVVLAYDCAHSSLCYCCIETKNVRAHFCYYCYLSFLLLLRRWTNLNRNPSWEADVLGHESQKTASLFYVIQHFGASSVVFCFLFFGVFFFGGGGVIGNRYQEVVERLLLVSAKMACAILAPEVLQKKVNPGWYTVLCAWSRAALLVTCIFQTIKEGEIWEGLSLLTLCFKKSYRPEACSSFEVLQKIVTILEFCNRKLKKKNWKICFPLLGQIGKTSQSLTI